MTFLRATLALVMLAGAGVFILANQPTISAQSPVAYIALGDSIAFGIGSSLPERRGYPPQVQDLLATATGDDVTLYNLSVPGETAATFMSEGQVDRLADTRRQLEEQRVPIALVTLSLGGNEMLAQRYSGVVDRQQALGDFRTALDTAISRVIEEVGTSPRIVLTTYYDLSEGNPEAASSDAWWTEQFNAAIRETAERHSTDVAEVGPAFQDYINRLTLHPYDVHPNNQGFRAIAGQVWAALGLDTEAPAIRVLSNLEASRRTPTLQLEVIDEFGVEKVLVTVNDREPVEPVDVGGGRYVMLLDLRTEDANEFQVEIEASDLAGNVGQTSVQLVVLTN